MVDDFKKALDDNIGIAEKIDWSDVSDDLTDDIEESLIKLTKSMLTLYGYQNFVKKD